MEGDLRQKTIFAVICVIASLFLGVLISVLFIGADLMLGGILRVWATILVFLLLATLTYFSLNFFGIQEKNIFWIMLTLGVLISLSYASFNILAKMGVDYLQSNIQSDVGGFGSTISMMFSRPSSPIAPVIFIIISYLILPIVFILTNRNKTENLS